ncbi:hypothetical protein ACMUE1_00800, partial [Candidatus Phytoplasma asteris]
TFHSFAYSCYLKYNIFNETAKQRKFIDDETKLNILKLILKENQDLKVKVTLEMQKDDKGFYFKPTAILGIQDMTLEQTEIIADATHKRC